MSDNRKYYYMRLKENFFDADEMKILESMQDGYLYSNILLKLYLRSLKYNGRLMFNDLIPYTPQIIATVTGHPVGVVEKALDIFQKLGLIEIMESGAIYMLNIQEFIGKTTTEADRRRKYDREIAAERAGEIPEKSPKNLREISGKSQRKFGEISEKSTPEIEKEREKELEKEIEIDTDYCSDLKRSKPAPEPYADVEAIPLNDGSDWRPFISEYDEYARLFPAVDIAAQFRAMRSWSLSNPARRKTRSGVKRFVNTWLSKEQDRGRRSGGYRSEPTGFDALMKICEEESYGKG